MTLIPRVLFWMLAHLLWFLPHISSLWWPVLSGLRWFLWPRASDLRVWDLQTIICEIVTTEARAGASPPVVSSLWQWMTRPGESIAAIMTKGGTRWAEHHQWSGVPDTGLTRAQIRVILRRSDRSGLGNVNRWLWHTLSVILGNIWLNYAGPGIPRQVKL